LTNLFCVLFLEQPRRASGRKLWNWTKKENWRIYNLKDMKLGPQTHFGAKCHSKWPIQLVPKPREMAMIIARRRRGTWEGMKVANWRSELMCRMERARRATSSYTHYICCGISPAVAGCGSRSRVVNDNTWKWLVLLHPNLQSFSISNFCN